MEWETIGQSDNEKEEWNARALEWWRFGILGSKSMSRSKSKKIADPWSGGLEGEFHSQAWGQLRVRAQSIPHRSTHPRV